MGCSNSKGSRPEQRGPRLQQPPTRSTVPPQSLIRVKLVLLGATGVGKSCLVVRYVKGLFESASRVTVGAAFLAHSVGLPDGRTVKFEIWDTAGQERYASLAPLYYRGAGAAVVMYDITSAETFTKAKYWVTELQKNAPGNLVIVLAGNKSDLVEMRQVSVEEGQAYAASNSMMFLETSAKTAANQKVADVANTEAADAGDSSLLPSRPHEKAQSLEASQASSEEPGNQDMPSDAAPATKSDLDTPNVQFQPTTEPAEATIGSPGELEGETAKASEAKGRRCGKKANK
ncbi:hypothetical protein WJX84_010752 [Apatococcus fuscideae]|uniref:Uncharacterized protein n=1 Tax=Apatococcus fuscideae TaxID=2026836 RepID=A0AAW1TG91_9CHLO